MSIEKVLAKFNPKGCSYEQKVAHGGKPLLSVEDQIAAVGITWKRSPVGFVLLFAEVLNDKTARYDLNYAALIELQLVLNNWRGSYGEYVSGAIAKAAVDEALTLNGQICGECNGAGVLKDKKRNSRPCQACDEGRVKWDKDSRYARFCHYLPTKRERYESFYPYHESILKWLRGE